MRVLHYWSGCTFRARYPESVEDHVDLLEMLGYEVKRFGEEGCCGYPLILAGEKGAAKTVAEETSRKIGGAGLIVTECPGCYRVFREEYPKMGFRTPETRHLSQILSEHAGSFGKFEKETVSYHDPCDLGRLGGDYDSPRKVLRDFAEIVEPAATKERANCCGAGGLMLIVAPELSIRIAEAKIENEFEPIGTRKLITACPSCLFNLSVAASRREGPGGGIQVLDLASYVLGRLKGNG
ncbi:MAG: (Fe-S)-binding protein [Thermoproteota archaeon]